MNSSLQQLREKINAASSLTPAHKQELLGLVDNLRQELESLAHTDHARAQNVSSLAKEAAAGQQESLENFSGSVEELEITHPKLVNIVNRICKMLSDIGI